MVNVIFSHISKLVNSTLGYLRNLALLFCLSLPSILFADQWVNTEYNTTEGNEFWVTTMKNAGAAEGDGNVVVYLYATSRQATYINIVAYNSVWDTIIKIPAGGQNGLSIPLEYVYTDENNNDVTMKFISHLNTFIWDAVSLNLQDGYDNIAEEARSLAKDINALIRENMEKEKTTNG